MFVREGRLLRQVNASYQPHYDRLMGSGLYARLVDAGLLVPHEEVDPAGADGAYRILRPEPIPFISYPYEWCFSQLKHAALATLDIQRIAIDTGMSLKDASAYNIQFRGFRPVLIDTLSFEVHDAARPWFAYRQFCQHFLAPLMLMAHADARLNQLSRVHLDGIPLDLASRLLPRTSWFRLGSLMHLHLHARFQKRHENADVRGRARGYTKFRLLALIDSLRSAVAALRWRPPATVWTGYAGDHPSYSAEALRNKQAIVSTLLGRLAPGRVWDLGANTGEFSRLAAARGAAVISLEMDAGCVERSYLRSVEEKDARILPLVMDLTNPSPGIGWEGEERAPLLGRDAPDAVMALGLIHHLALGNNLPLDRVARFLARIAPAAIVEFIPASDPFAARLLWGREELAADYSEENFRAAAARHFGSVDSVSIPGSDRKMFLLQAR